MQGLVDGCVLLLPSPNRIAGLCKQKVCEFLWRLGPRPDAIKVLVVFARGLYRHLGC